jgi:hypothetical protein
MARKLLHDAQFDDIFMPTVVLADTSAMCEARHCHPLLVV